MENKRKEDTEKCIPVDDTSGDKFTPKQVESAAEVVLSLIQHRDSLSDIPNYGMADILGDLFPRKLLESAIRHILSNPLRNNELEDIE